MEKKSIGLIKAYCPERRKTFTWSQIRPKNLIELIKIEGLILEKML